MTVTVGLLEAGILVLVIFALGGIALAFLLPHRIRAADISSSPEVREAFRGNLIQTVTLLLVVIGAAVALKQLAASLDQLQDVRLDQLADEVEAAEARLQAEESDEQTRLDAIADLSRLHTKSPEHRFRIERDLLRYVQKHAALPDRSALPERSEPPEDVQRALDFLLTKGQEQVEPDWETMGEGSGLVLANLDLRGISLPGATLTGADLSRTLLWDADLQGARLDGTVLVGTELQRATLQRAVLRGSILTEADLEAAKVTETDLTDADLRGVRNLTWAQVRDASIACSSKLPERLPASSRSLGDAVPMILVLRDCLQPRELQLPAASIVPVLFGTTLPEPVVLQAPDLAITVRVPDRTQVVQQMLYLDPGTYAITGQVEFGASQVDGRLIANSSELVLAGEISISDAGGSSVSDASGGNALAPTATFEPLPTSARPTPTPSAEVLVTPVPTFAVWMTPIAPTTTAVAMPLPAAAAPTATRDFEGFEDVFPLESEAEPPQSTGDAPPTATPRAELARMAPTRLPPTKTPTPKPMTTPTAVPTSTPTPPATATTVPDRACSDFTSQEDAQAFFEAAGGPELDLHRLDTDGDGIACAEAP